MVSELRWVLPINKNILSSIIEKYQENIFHSHVHNSKGIMILFLFGDKHACVYVHVYVLNGVCSHKIPESSTWVFGIFF